MSAFDETEIRRALRHLRAADPVIREVIARSPRFKLRRPESGFAMLARSITSQQISTKAARSIQNKLRDLLPGRRLTPAAILALSQTQLRSAGLSGRKAEYLTGLAEAFDNGTVNARRLTRRTDEEVISELSALRGIGVWTAQMYLMFGLGRMDVLPYDDLGIRTAIRNLYNQQKLPGKIDCEEVAAPWRPFATVACWYCWRSLETIDGPAS